MCLCAAALSQPAPGLSAVGLALGVSPAAAPPRDDLRLERVCVVNPGAGRIPDATLHVRDGAIASIEPTPERERRGPPERFVLPGLVDLHTHAFPGLRDLFARLNLVHGVTSVRDTGSDPGVFGYRRAVTTGRRASPRVFACGPLLDGKPPAFPPPFGGSGLDTPEKGRRAVRDLARRGADHLKVFINLGPPVLDAIREEAREHSIPIVGHVPRFSRIEDGSVPDVQHLTGIPEGPTTAFAVDGSFGPWLRSWARVDGDRLARVADACLENETAHTATLVLWKGLVRVADPTVERPDTSGLLPSVYVDAFWNARRPPAPYLKALTRDVVAGFPVAWPHMLEAAAALREAGVALLPGTDVINPWIVPGRGLHEELETFVEIGHTPEEALALATREAGRRLRVPGLGVLEEGAPADLMVLRRDPTEGLAHLDSIETTVVDGRAYDVASLRDEQADFCERYEGTMPRLLARFGVAALTAVYSALPAPPPPGEES